MLNLFKQSGSLSSDEEVSILFSSGSDILGTVGWLVEALDCGCCN